MPRQDRQFAALAGWPADDHGAALAAYARTADLLGPEWPRPEGGDPRQFFEDHFGPEPIAAPGFFTGYFEPVLDGALTRGGRFCHPLYRLPGALPAGRPWFNRAEIAAGGLLEGSEIVWLASPVDAFFAEVQGSLRVRLPDGSLIRLGYAGRNGHGYRSIGAELVRRGAVGADAISAAAIRDWCAENPDKIAALFTHNPSVIFFRILDLPEEDGPIGSMGRPVTAGRSLAVDPDHVPLGAPVWVETAGVAALMIAQDTGSAIRGAGRGDIFCGTGPEAGLRAGALKCAGRMVPLLPRRVPG